MVLKFATLLNRIKGRFDGDTVHERVIRRFIKELEGNNLYKVIADKSVRYVFTIIVLGFAGYGWQIVNEPLLIVAFAMPVIDLVLFDLIDKYRKPKA